MKSLPQLNHLGLYTAHFDAMEKFYVDVIGMVVTDRGTVARLGGVKIIFLSANADQHHQLALVENAATTGPSCVNQIAFKVKSLEELRSAHERIQSATSQPALTIDHGNAWSLYALDPDGNGIEVYLDTPWQIAQPHSRPFDLSASDESIMAATEIAVRADPTFQLAGDWTAALAERLA
ncbi:VOC family protein [Caballeronia sordidicola]|uniref:Putative ring-cleavage dioxygenase n=1 Tax=Caballeronia sordidicola TaxID=196367 RepID=A0A242MXS8_CABSO|nr:VOC family protein [Caballeronia sordidicola]OTP76195.1 putative ring-cleavage dioxygenase [Caballeronia sordidicola]